MEKLKGIVGLPVLETETGGQIGEVVEVILDLDEAIICGFVIADEKWFAAKYFIAFTDVFSIGRDAIMVRNQQVIKPLHNIANANSPYYLRDLFDKQLFTDGGLCLGIVVDIGFESATGEIKWYEVSDCILTDLLYGRMIMPLPQTQIVGEHKVIVPEAMARLLQTETKSHKDG